MILNKKCMKCAKAATHKFVRIENSQVYDMYFCQEHAAEASPYQKPKVPLSEILANFLNPEAAAQAGEVGEEAQVVCTTCGLPFSSYRKTLMLGCADCYDSFRDQLMPELRKFHGNTKHVGRKPGGGKETSAPIELHPPSKKQEPETKPKPEAKPAAKKEEAQSATHGGGSLLKDPEQALRELTQAMNKAIADEDFEKAALCRDQIREIRESLKK